MAEHQSEACGSIILGRGTNKHINEVCFDIPRVKCLFFLFLNMLYCNFINCSTSS